MIINEDKNRFKINDRNTNISAATYPRVSNLVPT